MRIIMGCSYGMQECEAPVCRRITPKDMGKLPAMVVRGYRYCFNARMQSIYTVVVSSPERLCASAAQGKSDGRHMEDIYCAMVLLRIV